jgi:hypothetical protein
VRRGRWASDGDAQGSRWALVSGSLPPEACGVGDYANRLATALSHPGTDVQILTTAGSERMEGAMVDLRATVRSGSIFNLAAVRKQIRGLQPGVVHLHYPMVAYGAGPMPQALVLSEACAGTALWSVLPKNPCLLDKEDLRALSLSGWSTFAAVWTLAYRFMVAGVVRWRPRRQMAAV